MLSTIRSHTLGQVPAFPALLHFCAQQQNDRVELCPNSPEDIPQEQQALAWAAQLFKDSEAVRRVDQTLLEELAKLRIADLEGTQEYEQYRLKMKTQLIESFIRGALAQLDTLIYTNRKTGFQKAFNILEQLVKDQQPQPHIMRELIQHSIEKLEPLIPKALNYEQVRIKQALKLLRDAVAPAETGVKNVLLGTAGKEAYTLLKEHGLIELVPSACPKVLQVIWVPVASLFFYPQLRLTEKAKKRLFKQAE